MKFRDKFLDIITYHGDEGTSGYELSNEQIEGVLEVVKQLVKEAKPWIIAASYGTMTEEAYWRSVGHDSAINEYEDNLLAALGEEKPVDLTGVIEGDSELSSD